MRRNNVLGILFANINDDEVHELTNERTLASIPFGGRYRVIDFPLSNMVNSGIRKVGIITRNNYQSLMDHLGTGKEWDLSRKRDGLYILPPFSQVEDYGIVTLARPTTRQDLYTSVKMLSAVQMKIKKLEKEMRRLKERLQEQQTIDRAKWVLVDQRKMSEPDAHRYIEKSAMDRCVRKIRIAEEILRDS